MRLAVACLVVAAMLAGCLGGPSVDNAPGSFSFAVDAQDSSERYDYDWKNDGRRASVSWDMTRAHGLVTVAIADDGGNRVFLKTFEGGTQNSGRTTSEGSPGSWGIKIELDGVDGPVEVKVRSA